MPFERLGLPAYTVGVIRPPPPHATEGTTCDPDPGPYAREMPGATETRLTFLKNLFTLEKLSSSGGKNAMTDLQVMERISEAGWG